MDGLLTSMEKIAAASLAAPDFRDIWLYAPSKRTRVNSGKKYVMRATCPRPVVAVKAILEETVWFREMLYKAEREGSVRESKDSEDTCIETQQSEYDYEDDSDLEDGETSDAPQNADIVSKASTEPSFPQLTLPAFDIRLGRLMIPNVAYQTLRALVFYLYSGKVAFLRLKSQGLDPEQRSYNIKIMEAYGPPPCSPKSLLRIAGMANLPKLRTLAFDELVKCIGYTNVVEEAFSRFASRQHQFRGKVALYIRDHYTDRTVQQCLQAKLRLLARGYLPHAVPIMQDLMGFGQITLLMNRPPGILSPSTPGRVDGSILCPSKTQPNASGDDGQPSAATQRASAHNVGAPFVFTGSTSTSAGPGAHSPPNPRTTLQGPVV